MSKPGPPQKTLSDVAHSVTQKALYPRCATCKHYYTVKKWHGYDVGGCEELGSSDNGLKIDPDFGCVLHEEK